MGDMVRFECVREAKHPPESRKSTDMHKLGLAAEGFGRSLVNNKRALVYSTRYTGINHTWYVRV